MVVPSVFVVLPVLAAGIFAWYLTLFWLPRAWAVSLLDAERFDAEAVVRRSDGTATVEAARLDTARLEAVTESFSSTLDSHNVLTRQWDVAAVLAVRATRRHIGVVDVDRVDRIVARAWLRSGITWWLWAAAAAAAHLARCPGDVVAPRRTTAAVIDRCATVAARHRAGLSSIGLADGNGVPVDTRFDSAATS